MKSWKKWLAGVCAAGIAMGTLWNSAAAATDNTMFLARYEHNALLEAELLNAVDTADSSSGIPDTVNISGIVGSLYSRILPFYKTELSLAAAFNNHHALEDVPIKAVLQNRQDVLAGINAFQKGLSANSDVLALLANNSSELNVIQVDLKVLRQVMLGLPVDQLKRKSAPTYPELAAVRRTIFLMQRSVIDLASVWLAMTNDSRLQANVANISGFAYNTAVVARASDHNLKDMVVAFPIATTGTGQIAPDIGTYSLKGPAGYKGVAVNALTGTLNVESDATPGNYTVVYTENNVAATAAITIS